MEISNQDFKHLNGSILQSGTFNLRKIKKVFHTKSSNWIFYLMALVTVFSFVSCENDSDEILPEEKSSQQTEVLDGAKSIDNNKTAISDGANGGKEGFYFLPPMVKSPSYEGVFDPNLTPIVEIFESTECIDMHTSFSMEVGEGSETLRVDEIEESYVVNWHTDQTGTQVGQTYRIRISIAGSILGHADIQMAENGKEAKNITGGEAISLVDGRTLPIKFRIEEGAVNMLGPEGGVFTTKDGLVNLDIPANAVDENIAITVKPVNDELNDPDLVPGAIYDFGPSPYRFNEKLTLTIKYDPEKLPVGVLEDELRLLAVVDGEWVQLPGSAVDVQNHTVTGPLISFSRKGVGRGKVHAIEVLPADPSIAVGETVQFEAMVTNVDSEVMSRKVQWSSSDEDVATVNNSGLVTAITLGQATVEAKSGKFSGTSVLTVESQSPVASRIEVTPPSSNVEVGNTRQFTATVYDQDDLVIENQIVTWSSSNFGIANVDESGLANGIAEGEATITATVGTATGNASLVVTSTNVSNAFVTKWDTNLGLGTTIALALGGNVEVIIDWGDGTSKESVTGKNGIYHVYETDGVYTVSVEGKADIYSSRFYGGRYDERHKLVEVVAWGDLGFTNMTYAFEEAVNLRSVPSSSSGIENVTNMSYMFYYTPVFNADLGNWDTSNVTTMSNMFAWSTIFNGNIEKWDTSNVNDMSYMFNYATSFNQNIGGWDTGKVTNMETMFADAYSFNGDIGSWDIRNVTTTYRMFSAAKSFNQDIGNWDTGNVIYMGRMLESAYMFNQNIGGWNTSKVVRMEALFADATSFNQNIGDWITTNVITMQQMFYGASFFNQNIGAWDTRNVQNMSSMFLNAEFFNQDLSGWCVSNITSAPNYFDAGATNWVLPRPIWGTCPTN